MWSLCLLLFVGLILATEWQVYADGKNHSIWGEDDDICHRHLTGVELISRGKRVYQSSDFGNFLAEYALDGDLQTLQMTGSQSPSFLVVALLGTYRVNCVKVNTSPFLWKDESLPLNVDTRLFNSDWVSCGTISGMPEYGKEYQISCHGVLASHVRLSRGGHLSLAEVEVFGEHVDMGLQLLSRGKPAIQSSTDINFNAQLAVDGKSQHMFIQTLQEMNPWWQVNLKGQYRVYTVRIFNSYFTDHSTNATALSTVQVFTQPPDTNIWILCGGLNEPVTLLKGVYEVNCKGRLASHVRLQLAAKTPQRLFFGEVEVYGRRR